MELNELEQYTRTLKQEVLSLTNQKNKLELAIKDLEDDRVLVQKRTDEMEVYTKRLELEYTQLLEHRRATLKQIEIEDNNLITINEKKMEILKGIKDNIEVGQREVNILKKEYSDFIKNINAREKKVIIEENLIGDVKKSIQKEIATLKLERDELDNKFNEIIEMEELVAEKKNSILNLENKVKSDRDLVNQNLNTTNQMRIDMKQRKIKLANKIDLLKKEEDKLNLQKEAVEKEKGSLDNIKKSIEDNRKHLESQQQTLKTAFEELKRLKK